MAEIKLEQIIKVIKQAVQEHVGSSDDKLIDDVNSFLNSAKTGYVLVEWPESQDLMEADWFREEAVLSDNSSYFVPIRRIISPTR